MVLALIVVRVLEGCTTECVVSADATETPYWQTQHISYADLAAKGGGDDVSIVMDDGSVREGRLEATSADSIVWKDSQSRLRVAAATTGVRSLGFSHHYALEGALAGLLVGVVPPLLAGSWAVTYDGNEHTPQYIGREFTGYLGAMGMLTGLITGACISHTYECTFERLPGGNAVPQRSPD